MSQPESWLWYQVLYGFYAWSLFLLFILQYYVAKIRFTQTGKQSSSVANYFHGCGVLVTLFGILLTPDPVRTNRYYPLALIWFFENNQSSALFSAEVYLLYRTIGINYQFGSKNREAGPPILLKLFSVFIVALTTLFGNFSIILFAFSDSQFVTTGLYAFWFAFVEALFIFALNFGVYSTRQILRNLSRTVPVRGPGEQTLSRKKALRNLALIQLHLHIALILGFIDRVIFCLSTTKSPNGFNRDGASTVLPWLNCFVATFMLWYAWTPIAQNTQAVSEHPKAEVIPVGDEDEMLTFTAMLMGKRATSINFSPPKDQPLTPQRQTSQGTEIELLANSEERPILPTKCETQKESPEPIPLSSSASSSRPESPSSPLDQIAPGSFFPKASAGLVSNLVIIDEEKSLEEGVPLTTENVV